MTHVLIIQAKWDGSIPEEIVAVYDPAAVVQAFERLHELLANGSADHEGARFVLDMHEVIAP